LSILDHNFWTRNVKKSIKGSSLFSNKNFSETLWPSGWALGQATWAKMTLKLLYLWRYSQKMYQKKNKSFWVQSARLAQSIWAVEQVSNAIGRGARALV